MIVGTELRRASLRDLSSCCCASFLERVIGECRNPKDVIPANERHLVGW